MQELGVSLPLLLHAGVNTEELLNGVAERKTFGASEWANACERACRAQGHVDARLACARKASVRVLALLAKGECARSLSFSFARAHQLLQRACVHQSAFMLAAAGLEHELHLFCTLFH